MLTLHGVVGDGEKCEVVHERLVGGPEPAGDQVERWPDADAFGENHAPQACEDFHGEWVEEEGKEQERGEEVGRDINSSRHVGYKLRGLWGGSAVVLLERYVINGVSCAQVDQSFKRFVEPVVGRVESIPPDED